MIGALGEPRNKQSVSASRTYVAVCNTPHFDGYYFKKFTLPEKQSELSLMLVGTVDIRNDAGFAAWWFLNVLNFEACIEGCITFEDYRNISDQKEH